MDNLKTDGTEFPLPKKKFENQVKVYILYLNKEKDFKQDKIMFNEYNDAVVWAKKNLDNFSLDMIKYESIN